MKRHNLNSIIKTAVFISIINIVSVIEIPAQGTDYRKEVFGNIGYGKIYDDETNLGGGVGVGGGFGYRFTRRLGVDFEVNSLNHNRDAGVWEFDGRALTAGAGFQVHFLPESPAQPFIRAGLVWARYEANFESRVAEVPPIPNISYTQNVFGPEVGGGIRFFIGKRWSVRPEFRMTILDNSRDYVPGRSAIELPLCSPRFNLGIGYHW